MDKNVLPNPRLIRLSVVEDLTGFGKSYIYAAIKSGVFPPPIKAGRATRFLESEIFDWIRARVAADRDGSDPAPKLLDLFPTALSPPALIPHPQPNQLPPGIATLLSSPSG